MKRFGREALNQKAIRAVPSLHEREKGAASGSLLGDTRRTEMVAGYRGMFFLTGNPTFEIATVGSDAVVRVLLVLSFQIPITNAIRRRTEKGVSRLANWRLAVPA